MAGGEHRYIIVLNNTLALPKVMGIVNKFGKIKEVHSGTGILIASGSKVVKELLKEVKGVVVAKDYKMQFLPPPTKLQLRPAGENITADPYYPYQWDMMFINASPEKAWSISTGDPVLR